MSLFVVFVLFWVVLLSFLFTPLAVSSFSSNLWRLQQKERKRVVRENQESEVKEYKQEEVEERGGQLKGTGGGGTEEEGEQEKEE